MPRRILFFATDAYGSLGGISQFNRDLCKALVEADDNVEVSIVPRGVPDTPGELPERVSQVHGAAAGRRAYLAAAFRETTRARNVAGAVAAHLHLLPVAYAAARAHRVPLLLILHGIEAWRPTRWRLTNYLASCAPDAIGAVSEMTRTRYTSWSKYPAARVRVLGNCVDMGRFSAGPRPGKLIHKWGLTDKRVILTLGRLAGQSRMKGFDVMLEALPEIIAREPSAVYVIAGSGPDESRLRCKADHLGVATAVRFVGHVPECEKQDYYRLADVFALPSEGEGFGIVLLEALASGVPAVASTRDGGSEALRNGKLGCLVDPRDRKDLVTAILDAFGKPQIAQDVDLRYFGFPAFKQRWAGLFEDHGMLSETENMPLRRVSARL